MFLPFQINLLLLLTVGHPVLSLIVMDVVFSNRISSAIFKECARAVVDGRQYNEVPIELRKRMEDCFDTYLDHANIVIRGVQKADNVIPVPPS